MTVLRRDGYVAKVEFDGRDQLLVGRVLGIDDVVGFHSDSVAGLAMAFGEGAGRLRGSVPVVRAQGAADA